MIKPDVLELCMGRGGMMPPCSELAVLIAPRPPAFTRGSDRFCSAHSLMGMRRMCQEVAVRVTLLPYVVA